MKTLIKYLFLCTSLLVAISCSVEDGIDGMNGLDGINGSNGTDGEDGNDGTNGTDGTDGQDGQDATGLTYVYILGDITNAEAATKIQTEVGSTTQFIFIENTSLLTTVDLSSITTLASISISNNELLETVNLSGLQQIYQTFYFGSNPLVASLNLSNLQEVGGGIDIRFNSALSTIDFSDLITVTSMEIAFNAISALNFPNLTATSEEISIAHESSLTSINFPVLLSASGRFVIIVNPVLATLSFPLLSSMTGNGDFHFFQENNFDSNQINELLSVFANMGTSGLSGASIILNNQQPPAPPTGQGIIDLATVIANGNNVLTD